MASFNYMVVQMGFRKEDNSPYMKLCQTFQFRDGGCGVNMDNSIFLDGHAHKLGEIVTMQVTPAIK